ncbi:beta strand repeat-containing protein, partial [Burkholderia stabilis]|uniref:beta strand repeat-containing protein n=1 Tax=Burkholderia stabilis TaxID=95485 RepID=UPI00158FB296
YDSATKGKVTLGGEGGTTLSGVKAGVANTDAVNVSQLKDSGLIGTDGKSIAAVTYDDATKGKISLGGANGTKITKVAAGDVSAKSTDAINGAQLFATNESLGGLKESLKEGGVIDPTTGKSLAVVYDSAKKDKVTLGGEGGAILSGVKAGVANTDAVNVSQLKDSGLIGTDGKSIAAVTYDDATKGKVTLGGKDGTTLSGVKAGVANTDAVNVSQLKDAGLIGTDGKSVAAVTYDDATKGKISLGGATGTKITKVAAGDVSAKSTDAINGSQLFATNESLGGLKESLKEGGVIDPTTGKSLAVVYDDATKGKVTLGGEGGTTLSGVKAGVANTDAVNVAQLTTGLSDLREDLTNGGIDLKYIKVNATGTAALATGAQGVAIGSGASSSGPNTLALGSGARASANGAVAIGFNSVANQANTVSVGGIGKERKIVNLAAGDLSADSTDAINGSQLYAALNGLSTTFASEVDKRSAELRTRSIELRDVSDPLVAVEGMRGDNTASLNGANPAERSAIAVGVSSAASGSDATAIGLQALAGSDNSVAIGSFAQTGNSQPYAVAMGSDAQTNGVEAVALGARVQANEDNALAVGSNAKAIGKSSIALGNAAQTAIGATNSIAAGTGAIVQKNVVDAIALGTNASVASGSNGGIALGANSIADRGNALSIGRAGAERQIVNLAAGTKPTDAVNLGQLKGVTDVIGASVGPDGSIGVPTYQVAGKDYHDVASALAAAAAAGGGSGGGGGSPDAVEYDDASHTTLTLGGKDGTTLSGVKAGVANTDAVNVSQLKDAGLIGTDGKSIAAVTYDDATKSQISLGGANGTKITKVAAGDVSAKSTDAINGSQLFATNESLGSLKESLKEGGVVDQTTGKSLAVVYESAAKDKVTLGGKDGATLSGVKAGVADTDAVNVSQLKDAGLIGTDGKSVAAVTYDRNKDGTPNYGSVMLGNGKGSTQIKNVANATEDGDAVNLKQLKEAGLVGTESGTGDLTSLAVAYDDTTKSTISLSGAKGSKITNVTAGTVNATSKDAVNGSQLFGTADSIAGALGGGAKVNPDGTMSAPSYSLDGRTVTAHSVGDAIENLDTRVTGNTGDIKDLKDALAGTGVVDPSTGKPIAAVTYDRKQDGTPDRTSVTLGEAGTPVGLHNVAAGKVSATSNDAINGSQLHGTAQSIAAAIGGDTTVAADGTLANTAIEVNGQKYKTVAEAVQAAAQYGATDSLAVRYDLNSDGKPNLGSVTLGGANGTKITNVAAGDLSAESKDAVNGSQLFGLEQRINGMDDRVVQLEQNPGGGIGGSGAGSGDNAYFAGTDVTPATPANPANAGSGKGNVAAGSGASVANGANNAAVIGSSATVSKDNGVAIGSGANSSGTGATAIGQGSKATGDNSVALGSGSVASEANTVSFGNGTEEGNRRIVNIADGVNASDVATKGQLDRAIGGMRSQVNELSRNAYSGIAAATALTMIPGVDPGKTLSFGIGGATYKGYQAVALGGEARITQNLKMKAGVGMSSGGNTVGVGASYQW